MGLERDDEDPHLGSGPSPKLSLVGRLHGDVDGRPVSLVAANRELTVAADKLRTLLTLRRTWRASLLPLQGVFERVGIRVLVRSRWFGVKEVFPKPHYLIGFLLPRG